MCICCVSGRQELEHKLGVVSLVREHAAMVLLFYTMGLLPEHSGDL